MLERGGRGYRHEGRGGIRYCGAERSAGARLMACLSVAALQRCCILIKGEIGKFVVVG